MFSAFLLNDLLKLVAHVYTNIYKPSRIRNYEANTATVKESSSNKEIRIQVDRLHSVKLNQRLERVHFNLLVSLQQNKNINK